MEASPATLFRREVGDNKTAVNILIALLVLVFVGMLLAALLFLMRRAKRQRHQAEGLPSYNDLEKQSRNTNPNRLTIQTANLRDGRSSVIVFGRDGQPMLANPQSPPHSPDNVPQIHITFPDEHDDEGRRKSGRVVVVRVGETSVGMEPLHDDDQLPAYEKDSSSQFYTVDMEKIGGLKEKEYV